MPSVREATGVVLAEAMQNGLGVVTFNQGGARVALNSKVCRYVDPQAGAQGFADAMHEWAEKSELKPKKHDIEECFKSLTWECRAYYYMSLYRKFL